MESRLDPIQAIKGAYDVLMANYWTFLGLFLICIGVECIPFLFKSSPKAVYIAIRCVTYVISWIIGMGIMKISIAAVDNKQVSATDIFQFDFGTLILFFITSVLYMIGCVIGLILLIIPGIYIAFTYIFATYVIANEDGGIGEAFVKSGEMTKGSRWSIFVLGFCLGILNIVGALCLVVGLAITIPLSWVAMAYAYRQLSPLPRPAQRSPITPPIARRNVEAKDLAPAAPRKPIEVDYE